MLWYTERYPAMPKGGAAVTPEYDGAFDALDYTEETASGGGFWSRLFGG